ncbi:hypothetical protein D3C80_1997150 [compost metagenome]
MPFCGERHFEALGSGGCKRLFAINVFARFNGGERHLLVKPVWRRDVDEIDIRVGDQFPPISSGICKSQLFCGF